MRPSGQSNGIQLMGRKSDFSSRVHWFKPGYPLLVLLFLFLFFLFNCCLFSHSYELLIISSSTFLSFILIMFLDRIGSHRSTLEHNTEMDNCLLSLWFEYPSYS